MGGGLGSASKAEYNPAEHTTRVPHACVTADRTILVDSPPLFSSSVLSDAMVNDAAPQWPKSETHEQSHHMDCVRMGLWMFCVCHVVIVVSDRVEDPQLIQFLNSVSMLHTMLPREAIHMNMRPRQGGGGGSGSETGLSSTPDTLGMPHVVWAHCGADGAEPHSFAQHQSLLNRSLTFSSFFQQGEAAATQQTEKDNNGNSRQGQSKTAQQQRQQQQQQQ